ncbi:hypothetical protein ACTJI8_13805 [Microbacterium sp. 22303]|uniref:hypothetical protein n=1 Tax=Microbacterium sp. 22303 TaxID=3453905 RepID=UPI003F83F41E
MFNIEGSPLRIAYVTPYGAEYRAISTHTDNRINAWRDRGAKVEKVIIGGEGRLARSSWRNLLNDIFTIRDTVKAVSKITPDVIYVRWLTPIPGLFKALRRIAPIVVEIHADDLLEVAGSSRIRRFYLRMTRGRELRVASGATFVVAEISANPHFDEISGPREIFPNASWLQRRDWHEGSRPRVGLSVGAPFPASGIDRFGEIARDLAEVADWVIVCPAPVAGRVEEEAGAGVSVVPTHSEAEYVEELATWSVAFGSMGLERKGLRTASPLKVRDYVGLGIPTVLPYWDEGVVGVDDPMLWKVAGESDAPVQHIDRDACRHFIVRAAGQRLRESTSSAVSGPVVEARRLEFLRSFTRSS